MSKSPFGSLANPVALDPFQRIIAVHWKPRLFTHLAFAVQLKADNSDTRFHSESPPVSGTSPAPPNYFGGENYASTAFRYSGGAGPAIGLTAGYSNGSWTGADFDALGMPSNPVDPFWFNRTSFTEDDRAIGTDFGSQEWHWVDPGGDELDIPLPFQPDLMFKAGPASLEMYGPSYTGEKFAFDNESGDPVWLYEAQAASSFSLGNFPPPEVQVVLQDHTYTMIGARISSSASIDLVRMPRDSATPSVSGTLWVLLELTTS